MPGFSTRSRSTTYHYFLSLSGLAELAPAGAAALQGREEVISHKTAARRDRRCLVCGGAGRQRGVGATADEAAPAPPSRCAGRGGRSLIIRLGCPPRWAARSASFRGDGWILWEISRPLLRNGVQPLLTCVRA